MLFLDGYKEMLKRIKPKAIICHSNPFPEMEGNIIVVDYSERVSFRIFGPIKLIYGGLGIGKGMGRAFGGGGGGGGGGKGDGENEGDGGSGSDDGNGSEGKADKIINSVDDVTYGQSSIDKAFSKHSSDFGKYPDGSKASVELFKNDINNLLVTGVQKSGTYRATFGTHVYNPSTRQWAFYNADGSFNTAFKLSPDQFKYLIETGVVK